MGKYWWCIGDYKRTGEKNGVIEKLYVINK
jgi:hypothetical protein